MSIENNINKDSVILVTGVAGFIGAKTAELLLHQGRRVVGVDNLNDYYDVRLKHHRLDRLKGKTGFTFIELDISNEAAVNSLFAANQFSVVINLAARAGVRASLEKPLDYHATNATGTLILLECMRRFAVRKLVLASTSSLYAGVCPPFSEDCITDTPISPYAASKKAAEVNAYTYHKLFGIDVSVVRYFTVYGPAGRPDMSPYRFIKKIYDGATVSIYGDGTQSRDFTYVDDIAFGTVLAIQKVGYQVFNLGGGRRPVLLLDLVRAIEAALGIKAKLQFEPFQETDMKETAAVVTKAKEFLGWVPEVDLEEGILRTVAWFRDNLDVSRLE